MNDSLFGIIITLVILCGVLGVATVSSGDFDIPEISLGDEPSEVEQAEERLDNTFYEWCYKMKIECQ